MVKKGNFGVTVIIEGGKISSISVGNNEETPDKGGVAIAQLPEVVHSCCICCKAGERNTL